MISEALKCNSVLTELNLNGDETHEIDNVLGSKGMIIKMI